MKTDMEKIIKTGTPLFSQYGTQSVSMGDIAVNCGISKKTIYAFFDSKETLIAETVKTILAKSAEALRTAPTTCPGALNEIKNLFENSQHIMNILTPCFIRELKKYYQGAYHLLAEFRENTILPFVVQNISKGIEEGVYRPDLDCEMVSLLYCWQLQNIYESASVPLQINELLSHTNDLFLQGIIHTKYSN